MKKLLFGLLALLIVAIMFLPLNVAFGAVALIVSVGYLLPAKELGVVNSTLPIDIFDALNAQMLRRNEERTIVPSFFSSFFRLEKTDALNVAFRTKRKGVPVAVDVNIQTKGIHHKRQVGTAKSVQPPMYHYFVDLQEKDLYNGIMSTNFDIRNIFEFGNVLMQDFDDIADRIDYAKELQCAQIFANGIVQFKSNDNINYGRSASSIVTASTLWTAAGADPYADFAAGIKWIRTNSRNNSTAYHLIMGSAAASALLRNAIFLERQKLNHLKLDDVMKGRPVPSGGVYMGSVYIDGGITGHLWSYEGEYMQDDGTMVSYLDKNNVIMIPDRNDLTLVSAAVKMLAGTPNVSSYRGKLTYDFLDFNAQVHYYHMKERALAIPQEINEIYTLKATNAS